MDEEYFYNMGIVDGKRLIQSPKSYREVLIIKHNNILKKYGESSAKEYKEGIIFGIRESKKRRTR